MQIFQDSTKFLIQDKKTVEWLVNNTSVNVFDPVKFEGYQRKIDRNHCNKIIKYLENNFFLPTSIICAVNGSYSSDSHLRIVDGQHRVEAFRLLSIQNPERYKQIKKYELSIVILEDVSLEVEINTFITINKTSKKVDTSLAYVLKNKLRLTADDSNLSKREYLAVELAQIISNNNDSLWYNKITFEGNPKNTPQLISLNAFVKSTRALLSSLDKSGLINVNSHWNSDLEIDDTLSICEDILNFIWNEIKNKWPDLFYTEDLEKRRIIQGAIGYTSINKLLIYKMKDKSYKTIEDFKHDVFSWIHSISIPTSNWYLGEYYSKFSSESGYNLVTMDLVNSMDFH